MRISASRHDHESLADYLPLASLDADAGQHDSLQQFLTAVATTARRSFAASEAFLWLGGDEDPVVAVSPGGTQSAAYVHRWLAAGLPPQAEEGGPVLLPIRLDAECIGMLGLFDPHHLFVDRTVVGRFLGMAINNFRLYSEARHHLARQSLLRDLGRVFSASGALGEKLMSFLRRIRMLRPVDGCWFSLFDADSSSRPPVAVYHLDDSTRTMPSDLEREVADRALPLALPDLSRWSSPSGYNSYLGLPIMRQGAVIGVLSLCARAGASFERRDVEFFMAVSEHTALLLENAWLLEETQRHVEEMTFVFNFTGILRREKTLDGVVQAVLEQCVQSVQADAGFLLSFDAETATFTPVAACGAPVPALRLRLPQDLGACELTYSENPRRDFPTLFETAAMPTRDLSRLLLVPLCTDRGLHSIMLVGHGRAGDIDDRERRLVSALTNAAENAIGRAMATEAMEARVREEAASRAKSEFLAVMSHELRTPLTSILGFTELLAENHFGPTNEKQQEYLQQVLGSGRHLLLLINDILDLAKVEAGKMELVREPVDLKGLLDELQRSFLPLVRRKNLTLHVDCPPLSVMADPLRLKQVLYNLVSNAVKFTDTGGISMRVREQDACVHFEVEDTGIGIPETQREAIFKPFSQGMRGNGRTYEGTGLGLSLSRRLAELQGGTLMVDSEVGVGSTFHVVLPHGGAS